MSDHSHAGPPVPAEPDAIGAAFRAWFDDHMRGLSVSGLEEDDLRQAFTTAWLQGARTQRATDRQMAIERGICQSRCLDHRHLPFADLRQCCDLHGRNCEPPSELCCERCTEADHPWHWRSGPCSSPDLSGNTLPEALKIEAACAQAAATERARILADVNALFDAVDILTDNADDYVIKIGFQAQQEVLESVRNLIGGDGTDG